MHFERSIQWEAFLFHCHLSVAHPWAGASALAVIHLGSHILMLLLLWFLFSQIVHQKSHHPLGTEVETNSWFSNRPSLSCLEHSCSLCTLLDGKGALHKRLYLCARSSPLLIYQEPLGPELISTSVLNCGEPQAHQLPDCGLILSLLQKGLHRFWNPSQSNGEFCYLMNDYSDEVERHLNPQVNLFRSRRASGLIVRLICQSLLLDASSSVRIDSRSQGRSRIPSEQSWRLLRSTEVQWKSARDWLFPRTYSLWKGDSCSSRIGQW